MRSFPKFLIVGATGLSIVVTLNLFALFILNQPAAAFFSDQWWPTWFSSYIIWSTFSLIGLIQKYRPNKGFDPILSLRSFLDQA